MIKQPVNTWSNLGFMAVGISMAWSLSAGSFQQNPNLLTRSKFHGALFSSVVVLLGPGSMAMHASGTRLGATFDGLSMYVLAAMLVSYSARRLFGLHWMISSLMFAVVLTFQLWATRQRNIQFIPGNPGSTAFAGCILLIILLEAVNVLVRRAERAHGWAYAAVGAIGLAYVIWNMSLTGRPWCAPESFVQGHAIWHLLCAGSIYCLFRYFVSERTLC
ncbi:MAG: ceramidase domain-containing protein [Rhizobiales bacterium]|nr:ceramidase domain-containing protein [Hyphomicrobiales bacterium]